MLSVDATNSPLFCVNHHNSVNVLISTITAKCCAYVRNSITLD